ncbi:MAG: ABC transporter permease [Fuerstiella sp.]
MNSQFYRLIWKEFRTQRPLWLILAICLVGLQVLIISLLRPSSIPDCTEALNVTTVILTFSFLALSVTLLFAGEEDQGTAIWLRQLPVSSRCLFWSKLTASLTGTMALVALSAVSAALILSASDGISGLNGISGLRGVDLPPDPGETKSALFFGGVLLLSSLFWSLRCRSVFAVLGYAAATLCMVIIVRTTLSESHWPGYDLLVLLTGVAVITPLPRRWQRGLSGPAQPATAARNHGRRSRWQQAASTILQRAVAGATVQKRTWSVLVWREWRLAVPFGLLILVLSVAAVGVRVLLINAPWPILLLFILVIECGLRTCRHDQQRLHGLFWSHRGISPLLVWAARNVVWLTILLLLAAGLFVLDLQPSLRAYGRNNLRIMDLINLIRVPQLPQWNPESVTSADRMLQVSVSVTWVLAGYFISQLCSCWIRRPLIAGFAALVSCISLTIWMRSLVAQDIPLWLTAWPLTLLVAVAPVLTRRQWMDRRTSVRFGIQRTLLLLVPMLCLWPVQAAWRMLQVPARIHYRAPEKLGYTLANQTSPWAGHWQRLDHATQPLHGQYATREAAMALDEESLKDALSAIDEILNDNLETRHLPPKWKTPWSGSAFPNQSVAFVMIQRAEQLLDGDQPEKALTRLLEAVRILRFLQREATSWSQWDWCLEHEQHVLQHIHRVAAHDQLTAAQLIRSAEILTPWTQEPVTSRNLAANRMAVYEQVLLRQGFLWEAESRLSGFNQRSASIFQASYAERIRVLKLISLASHSPLPGLDSHDPRRAMQLRVAASRYAATSDIHDTDLMLDPLLSGAPANTDNYHDILSRRNLNAERATILILKLQTWRRRQGSFPDTLAVLRPVADAGSRETHTQSTTEDSPVSQDPFRLVFDDVETGQPFSYNPLGPGVPYMTGSDSHDRTLIDAQQPVILTHQAGRFAAHRPWNADDARSERHRILDPDPNRIVYLDGSFTPIAGTRSAEQ